LQLTFKLMSKQRVRAVIRDKEMEKENHRIALEYRRHLRLQSLKIICLFVGIGGILGLTAYLALN
jgi:hypothetical protein